MTMWRFVSLAAVLPVANGLDVVLMKVECPKPVTRLVAVKPVTILDKEEVTQER